MMDVLTDLIQSASIIVLAITAFWITLRINRLNKRLDRHIYQEAPEIENPKPVCGCGHHQCFHDDNGCGHTTDGFDGCGCKRYTGPEPLPTIIP